MMLSEVLPPECIQMQTEKVDRLKSLLQQMKNCSDELALAGIHLNENITVDLEKWNAYFGL